MANKLNPFEEQLKKAANNVEVPYDASAWSRLESQLDGGAASGASSFTKWLGAAVAVVAVGIGVYYYSNPSSTEKEPIVINEVKVSEEQSNTDKPIVIEPVSNQEKEVATNSEIAENTIPKKEKGSDVESKEENTEVEFSQEEPVKDEIVAEKVSPIVNEQQPKEEPTKTAEKVVKEDLNFEIEINNATVCAGVEVTVYLAKPTNNRLVWTVDNDGSYSGKELVHTFFGEGMHVVQATNVETGAVSNQLTLKVNPKPDASFTLRENIENGAIPVVYFTANTRDEKYYKWTLGDGITGAGEEISHTYAKAKDYEVSLQVMNKFGCFETRYNRYTNEKEFNLLAPNSFSPNGDGTNDLWFPKALESGYYKFELKIYDRNNRLVYTTQDPQGFWNGMINGSQVKSEEFFMWNANVIDPNGIQQQYKGVILVVN